MLVAEFVGREFARRYARYRLTLPEWRLLLELHHDGPDSAGAIARRVGLSAMAASRAAASLLAAKRVSGEDDPSDARRRVLVLTPAGRALVARVLPEGSALDAALLASVSPPHREALAQGIAAMLEQAQKLPVSRRRPTARAATTNPALMPEGQVVPTAVPRARTSPRPATAAATAAKNRTDRAS